MKTGTDEYADCISAEGEDIPLISILDMTLNNLMARFQSKSIPSLPLLPATLWLGVVVPVRIVFMSQIELSNPLLFLNIFKCVQIELSM